MIENEDLDPDHDLDDVAGHVRESVIDQDPIRAADRLGHHHGLNIRAEEVGRVIRDPENLVHNPQGTAEDGPLLADPVTPRSLRNLESEADLDLMTRVRNEARKATRQTRLLLP